MGIDHAEWDHVGSGAAFGFHGLHLRTEAVAAFGEQSLRGGRWGDKQPVPRGALSLSSSVFYLPGTLRAQPEGRPAPVRHRPAPRRIPARAAQRPGRRDSWPRTRSRTALTASFDRSRRVDRSVGPVGRGRAGVRCPPRRADLDQLGCSGCGARLSTRTSRLTYSSTEAIESDEEPVDFLVLTYAERHRDLP
jgi:hypothetical protein